MASKPKPTPKPEDFDPEEMEQIQRYGSALQHGGTTDFDEEVERHLQEHEKGYAKMKAAQTGGSLGLGPTAMQKTAVQQQGAIQQQAGTAGQVQAAQAQAAQVSPAPPPAPGGSLGVTKPYASQRGETPPGVPERGQEGPEQEAPEAPGG